MRTDIKCNDPDRRLIDYAEGYATVRQGPFASMKVYSTVHEDGSIGETYSHLPVFPIGDEI